MSVEKINQNDRQYSLTKIVAIWAVVALPMAILAWAVTPRLIPHVNMHPGMVYWFMMIAGMMWQFAVSLFLVKREMGDLKLSTIRKRMWYQSPRDPNTGRPRKVLLLWVLPFVLLSGLLQLVRFPNVMSVLFPFIDSLPHYDMEALATPEFKGAWWLLALYLFHMSLNYLLGEEFLFRGILLPKMSGAFGKWDWFANGVLFGMYHLHKPPIMFWTAICSGFILSYPSKRFKSNWMAVIIHGAEGLFILFLIMGIILGLA